MSNATKQRVSVDLAKLALPGPGAAAGWAAEPRVREDARATAIQDLRDAGLPEEAVQSLISRLAGEYTTHQISDPWPTVGEDRNVLVAASDLARALATIIGNASPKAGAEIATAALKALGSDGATRPLKRDLERFAAALDARVAMLPAQTRQRPRLGIVLALDAVAGSVLPAPTTSPESKFYRACSAAFVLAGYPHSPDKAIKRFIELKAPAGR